MGETPSTPQHQTEPGQDQPTHEQRLTSGVVARSAAGGALMGLANLVPGISGGTMLVATGVYGRFIDAISDLSRLRIRPAAVTLLAVIVTAAVAAIGIFAGAISLGLAEFRWGMYSLFIGLTLGGVPIMLRMTRPMTPAAWGGLAAGLAAMLSLVVVQSLQPDVARGSTNPVVLGVAGAAGASAMILPGVSGAYLLLLLGQYETIIDAVKEFVAAITAADVRGAIAPMGILIPVGVGVVLGVVVIGNLLRFVLHHYEKATLGFLLGLLIAAPAGLYPFKEGTPPVVGEVFEGEVVTEVTLAEIDPKDWREEFFRPDAGHIAGSLGLIAAGFFVTLGVSRLGRERS